MATTGPINHPHIPHNQPIQPSDAGVPSDTGAIQGQEGIEEAGAAFGSPGLITRKTQEEIKAEAKTAFFFGDEAIVNEATAAAEAGENAADVFAALKREIEGRREERIQGTPSETVHLSGKPQSFVPEARRAVSDYVSAAGGAKPQSIDDFQPTTQQSEFPHYTPEEWKSAETAALYIEHDATHTVSLPENVQPFFSFKSPKEVEAAFQEVHAIQNIPDIPNEPSMEPATAPFPSLRDLMDPKDFYSAGISLEQRAA